MAARILLFPGPATPAKCFPAQKVITFPTTTTGHMSSSNLATNVEPFGMDMASKASAAGLGCARGTTILLTVEAAAAIVLYGLIMLLHLAR